MPTSGRLVEAVARATGLADSSVATRFRVIREADLIGTGGRGRSAMIHGAADAVVLLTACLASDEARFADRSVAAVFGLRPRPVVVRPSPSDRFGFRRLLKPSFFDRITIAGPKRDASFAGVATSLLSAIGGGGSWPLPESDDYAEGSVAFTGETANDDGPAKELRRFATISVTSRSSAGTFVVTGASISFGIDRCYAISRAFSSDLRSARGAFNWEREPFMRRALSLDLPALNEIASVFDRDEECRELGPRET